MISQHPQADVVAIVCRFATDRGVELNLPEPTSALRDTYKREPTTVARQLLYLETSIRPMLERLSMHVSRSDLLAALGIWYPEDGAYRNDPINVPRRPD